MPQNNSPTIPQETNLNGDPFKKRVYWNLIVTLTGFFIFLLGLRPDLFGMDRSPVIGFIQIAVSVIGLSILCLGGYLSMRTLWQGKPLSIAAEIGIRFISTGLVIAIFSALADFFGFGSHPFPESLPYLGEWQVLGIVIGEYTIAFGFFLMIPFPKIRIFPKIPHSSDSKR
ncbi:MAG TPA: hypothetical protein DCK95_09970 [Anaerolineaceae bacterium]|nr:hypothetical protein [Anaerolineaceae bacterium]